MAQPNVRKNLITEDADLCKSGLPQIYLLKLKPIGKGDKEMQKLEYGSADDSKPEKTIMLLGATGSGKTTLINGMINYILGVEWNDDFRVRLISEEERAANQDQSQTSKITSYTIHHKPWFKVPYTLTIVDTPGYGDSSGIERDKEITKQIGTFFQVGGDEGLDQITAIGFVVQAALARFTISQKYIFDSILSLFGNDFVDNIAPLITFGDGQKPPVLDCLTAAEIPYKMFFKFNNSALFVEKQNDEDCDFNEMFWKMGLKSFQRFFDEVQKMPNTSLTLTKEVLRERERLQIQIEGITKKISSAVIILHQLDEELDILKKHESAIDRNKDFEYTVYEEKVTLVKIPQGTFTTNCLNCKNTCHYPCGIEDNNQKEGCVAMYNGYCTQCDKKCIWSDHKNLPHKYIIEAEEVTKTSEELKRRYQQAQGDKVSQQMVVDGLKQDFEKMYTEVLSRTVEAKRCITRIREIALKPSPLSTTDYIDLMIETEKNDKRGGYAQRLEQLNNVRKTAVILDEICEEGYDPFKDQSATIAKVKGRYKATSVGGGDECVIM